MSQSRAGQNSCRIHFEWLKLSKHILLLVMTSVGQVDFHNALQILAHIPVHAMFIWTLLQIYCQCGPDKTPLLPICLTECGFSISCWARLQKTNTDPDGASSVPIVVFFLFWIQGAEKCLYFAIKTFDMPTSCDLKEIHQEEKHMESGIISPNF